MQTFTVIFYGNKYEIEIEDSSSCLLSAIFPDAVEEDIWKILIEKHFLLDGKTVNFNKNMACYGFEEDEWISLSLKNVPEFFISLKWFYEQNSGAPFIKGLLNLFQNVIEYTWFLNLSLVLGYADIAKSILMFKLNKPEIAHLKSFEALVSYLLESGISAPLYAELFRFACDYESEPVFNTIWDNYIHKPAYRHCEQIVQNILEKGNYLDVWITHSKYNLVKKLLEDPKVDPSVSGSQALKEACKILQNYESKPPAELWDKRYINNRKIILLLLSYPEVRPGVLDNQLLRHAVRQGDLALTMLLLSDTRINPSISQNALICGEYQKNFEIFKALFTCLRINPTLVNELETSNKKGKKLDKNSMERITSIPFYLLENLSQKISPFSEIILAEQAVNPAVHDDAPIRHACENGHIEIVQLLLTSPKVNPAAKQNFAIFKAAENGYIQIVELLLKDPRMNMERIKEDAKCWNKNMLEIIEKVHKNFKPLCTLNFFTRKQVAISGCTSEKDTTCISENTL